jgi:hypothetical protein
MEYIEYTVEYSFIRIQTKKSPNSPRAIASKNKKKQIVEDML